MQKQKINIQLWNSPDFGNWDDIGATVHEVIDPCEFAENLAKATGCAVRLTHYREGTEVGSLNGGYFRPQ